ncbi:HET-domain-containing protein [Dichomitus squalens]|uniref:HET-domain-containing protein n=1 Tax=Dichomitus squalens TaxID=114155 RepID=A0A4Q9PFP3_9APHY|nr:HET-domain-containing protein [Dichomitus squalens]
MEEGISANGHNATSTSAPRRLRDSLKRVWQFLLLAFARALHFCIHLAGHWPGAKASLLTEPEPTSFPDPLVESARTLSLHRSQLDDPPAPRGSVWDDPDLSQKVREACRVAREAGYRYIWIDSCCIDKTSSSELSESINSMYLWYGIADECYAYLADVPPGKDPHSPGSEFRSSRWFTRGWTLQELIAPPRMKFLSNNWEVIGTKLTLVDIVEEVTTVPREALLQLEPLEEFSVAQRLSWAAKRETTRVEDQAYSLLGIFDINIPTLYGEGERAFRRLQEEILRRVPDQSLFAFKDVYMEIGVGHDLAQCPPFGAGASAVSGTYGNTSERSLFALRLDILVNGGEIRAVSHGDVIRRLRLPYLPAAQYTSTPHGIHTQLPVIPFAHTLPPGAVWYPTAIPQSRWYLVILGCEHIQHPGSLLGRVCYIPPSESDVEYLYCGCVRINPMGPEEIYYTYAHLFPLSLATIERCREHMTLKTVYISHPERASTQSDFARRQPHATINLSLQRMTRDTLHTQGYAVELRSPDEDHPTLHRLTLSSDAQTIVIKYEHVLEDDGWWMMIKARATISRPTPDSDNEITAEAEFTDWRDCARWQPSLGTRTATSTLAAVTVKVMLGLDWAAPSHYFLRINVVTEMLPITPSASLETAQGREHRVSGASGQADKQDIGTKAGTSEGVVLWTDDDALPGMLDSDTARGVGEERGMSTERGDEADG